jgi:hypothetical protein
MNLINSILSWVMKKRIQDVEFFMERPFEVQEKIFFNLIQNSKDTEYGKKFSFKSIHSITKFKELVPIVTYEDIFPYINRMMKGEQNVLWPSEITWFGKSSGTTNARSKFIPVSPESLEDCHFKGGKDLLSIYINNHPEANIFTGKSLSIGGTFQKNELNKNGESFYGDISAVIMQNLPFWAEMLRTPSPETAFLNEWELKIERMAKETAEENVTSISGVPTWTLIVLQRVLEIKGAKNILEIWPNLELFMHGAVSFVPYRDMFNTLIPSSSMNYYETYNATEGFFGIQDRDKSQDMLLMLDYGIFYEFIPHYLIDDEQPQTLGLDQVEIGQVYALVISTNAGLFRYKIGDTIIFTSKKPYRIKVAGRTKQFINAFGEELQVANAETAIAVSCRKTEASIENFTAGPRFFDEKLRACHEWIIEFNKEPDDFEAFKKILDEELRKINSDYDAKRYKDIALKPPIIHKVEEGTFYKWMKKRGKLGGQNKVPRLSNNREYVEDILTMLKSDLKI